MIYIYCTGISSKSFICLHTSLLRITLSQRYNSTHQDNPAPCLKDIPKVFFEEQHTMPTFCSTSGVVVGASTCLRVGVFSMCKINRTFIVHASLSLSRHSMGCVTPCVPTYQKRSSNCSNDSSMSQSAVRLALPFFGVHGRRNFYISLSYSREDFVPSSKFLSSFLGIRIARLIANLLCCFSTITPLCLDTSNFHQKMSTANMSAQNVSVSTKYTDILLLSLQRRPSWNTKE